MITENIDVMVDNGTQFYCSLQYEHCKLFKFNKLEVVNFVLQKRPTLKFRSIQIFLGQDIIIVDHGVVILN